MTAAILRRDPEATVLMEAADLSDLPKFGATVFDIETAPLDEDRLLEIAPVFDPGSVKLGNTKDPEKITAKIEACRKSHYEQFFARAALSASTGQVLAIGYYDGPTQSFDVIGQGDNDESDLLDLFWSSWLEDSRPYIGLNIHDFDLPFLVRRSWILGVSVPPNVFDGRYFSSSFIDLRKLWLCGQRATDTKSSFDELARAFGTAGKPDGLDGSQFAELWWSDREKAVEYLREDVTQPAVWARAMGVA